MMMCIGRVTDFEAQLTASVERFARGDEGDMELRTRSLDWVHARCCDDGGIEDLLPPVEPSIPYSHGRRFIPAWLAADRERCMTGEMTTVNDHLVAIAWHRLHGLVRPKADTTIITRWA